jgi:hypothetical protein
LTIHSSTSKLQTVLGEQLFGAAPENLEQLLRLFNAVSDEVLLYLDNAEDLMRDDTQQRAFAEWLDQLLGRAPRARVLLTTRWPVETSVVRERLFSVPPLEETEAAQLLESELRALGVFEPAWLESRAWDELLRLIDGHPRTLALLASQFDRRPGCLDRVVKRLRESRDRAVVDVGLLGREKELRSLTEKQQDRLRSLSASMDLSLDVLEQRFPNAAKLFLALSLFPAGLPEAVAYALDEEGGIALDQLLRYNLAAWEGGRVSRWQKFTRRKQSWPGRKVRRGEVVRG